MTDEECVAFLQWALPRLGLRWRGFRKVRRQVCRRVARRLGELGLAGVTEYRHRLESHPGEWGVLDGLCTVTISRFYRHRGVFGELRDRILPSVAALALERREDTLRVWSAGCASGEEPYTLAILWRLVLAGRFPALRLRIVATDIDNRLLARAEEAEYSGGSLKELPRSWRERAFVREDSIERLRPEFREGIELRRQDIRKTMPEGSFHLVLCRNLAFTYFDEELQRHVARRIAGRLVRGGVLVVGASETVPGGVDELVPLERPTRAWQRS